VSHRHQPRRPSGAHAFPTGTAGGRAIAPALALALVAALAGCKADVPPLSGSDGSVTLPCSTYADTLLAYTPAGGGDSSGGDAALGAPDSMTVVVDPNTVLTLGFIGLGGVVEAMGNDIQVHGTAAADTLVNVYVSADGNEFVFTGTLDDTVDAIDLANSKLSLALYLQLVGQGGSLAVDSVEALQATCP
jgi:hypothetical protein